ncbi:MULTISPECIES: hypothetical protein [unclassified Arthrobacter]|uniref:hypothetical protein n=1 Tax=unclassified Arthrobacter TaxID=235627 RepID=UPI00159E7AC5|nr:MULTISPECIES: hypothetical protein [unclassified Arthrobacter]MCQ9165989.1 hypothetical protein [Arthrobacter sp. STN4]NVM98699.1 hypothetical protein [Arthrobacter sp. SDTb3-6]
MSKSPDSPSHTSSGPRLRPNREDPAWDYGDPFEAARVIWPGTGATGATSERSPHVPATNK